MNFEAVIGRLKEASGNTTNRAIAEMLGMSEQNLSTYKTKKTVPLSQIVDWCIDNKISIDWVLNGTVKELKANEQAPQGFLKIPFYPDIAASAGGGCVNGECEAKNIKFITVDASTISFKNEKSLFAIKASGDSMSGIILDGALLICDREQRKFKHNDIFVVTVYGDTFVKTLRKGKADEAVILHSFNHLYGDDEVPTSAVDIVAKVIQVHNKHNL